jgi:hypothetical protein
MGNHKTISKHEARITILENKAKFLTKRIDSLISVIEKLED